MQTISAENDLAASILNDSDLDLSVLWPMEEVVAVKQELEGSSMPHDKPLMQCCDARELDPKTYSDHDIDTGWQGLHEADPQTER